jgi:hypothetical protein
MAKRKPTAAAERHARVERERNLFWDRLAFMQDRIGALVQYLEAQEFSSGVAMAPMTLADVQVRLRQTLEMSMDENLCLNNCKNLYFCVRLKGHRGNHKDDMGFKW